MSLPKILIADDNLKLLKALTLRLEAEAFEVIASQDAYQALDFARRHQPDLILLDVNMPAGDGFSVQQRIAGNKELAGIPIIYLTGEKSAAVDEKAHELGAVAVIHKPFEMKRLLEVIRAALRRRAHDCVGTSRT